MRRDRGMLCRVPPLALVLVLVLACGEAPALVTTAESSPSTASVPTTTSTTTTSTTTTTTTVPRTTTTMATTTVPAPSAACDDQPSATMPASASDLVSMVGDVDGDGFEDTVSGYVTGSEAWLHVELATGWGTRTRVDDLDTGADGGPLVRPSRVVTMSGDQLVIAQVGLALPGPVSGAFALRDCSLTPIATADGVLPDLWVGGSPAHTDWFSCDPSGITMLGLAIEDFEAAQRVYTGGDGIRHDYEPPVFAAPVTVELQLDFPVTAEEAEAAYPSCSE